MPPSFVTHVRESNGAQVVSVRASGSSLSPGQIGKITDSTSGYVTCVLADSTDTGADEEKYVYILENISAGTNGEGIITGTITGVDTSTYTAPYVWLNASGTLSNTPSGGLVQLGKVNEAAGDGTIWFDGNPPKLAQVTPGMFGATGESSYDATSAHQAMMDFATSTGIDVLVTSGLHRLTDTVNIGLPIYTEYDTIVDRTGIVSMVGSFIAANNTANLAKKNINIRFEKDAWLVGDLGLTSPDPRKPLYAYNLNVYRGIGSISGFQATTIGAIVSGAYDPSRTGTLGRGTDRTIGLFIHRGCADLNVMFTDGIEVGLVTHEAFWTKQSNLNLRWAQVGASLSQINAQRPGEILVYQCTQGVAIDGSQAEVGLINSQQCDNDIQIWGGDCMNFAGGYLEDARGSGISSFTHVYVKDLDSSVLRTFRTSNLGVGKKDFDVVSSDRTTFIACRGTNSFTDGVSRGTLIQCDWDFYDKKFRVIKSFTSVDMEMIPVHNTSGSDIAANKVAYISTFTETADQIAIADPTHVDAKQRAYVWIPFAIANGAKGYAIRNGLAAFSITVGGTNTKHVFLDTAGGVSRSPGRYGILIGTGVAAGGWQFNGFPSTTPMRAFTDANASVTVNPIARVTYCSSTAARTVTLPASPVEGETYTIVDQSVNAGTNNITINAGAGSTIDGGSVTLSTNGASWTGIWDGASSTWFAA